MPVFDTPLGRTGAVICWENYMGLRTAMYAKRVQTYCAPTADGRETWLSTMRTSRSEGRCFGLAYNQFTRRRDFPADVANTPARAKFDFEVAVATHDPTCRLTVDEAPNPPVSPTH
jgi:hypothetical protein